MLSRSPPMNRIQRMVQRAEEIADDPTHGYSQKPPSGRWGPDFDCSSLMYEIADYAGYPVGTGRDKVRFTGTMLKDFEKAGFQILPFANVGISDLKIGDILLNLALHAEIYVGEGKSIGALSSESGGYIGESGDQTDQEIAKHPVITFDKGWDYVLRPPENTEESNDDYDEDREYLEEGGEEEMPMNYGPNSMMPTQPWQNQQQPWGNPPAANWNTGYPQGNRMMPNQGSMQGYQQGNQMPMGPQGNLGQMNGYSQANAGYPQMGGMQGYNNGYQQGNMQGYNNGYQQGNQSDGFLSEYCFVKGIEGARQLTGTPNSRKPAFDEDKCIFYDITFGPQGTPLDIHPWQFNDDFENMDDIPQHLSPLMHNMSSQTMSSGDYITRAEYEELKEMINNAKSSKQQNASDGPRNGQQSNPKLNARTN